MFISRVTFTKTCFCTAILVVATVAPVIAQEASANGSVSASDSASPTYSNSLLRVEQVAIVLKACAPAFFETLNPEAKESIRTRCEKISSDIEAVNASLNREVDSLTADIAAKKNDPDKPNPALDSVVRGLRDLKEKESILNAPPQ
jgi:hypothetical protein